MLPHDYSDTEDDAADFTERAEEARQLGRVRIASQQERGTRRYNLRHRFVVYQAGKRVWDSCTMPGPVQETFTTVQDAGPS